MQHLLVQWVILAVAIWVTAQILPGFHVDGFGAALLVAAGFGILSWLIGWFFFGLIGIVTLGIGFLLSFITRWIVNAIVLKITDSMMSSLSIRSFGVALVAALIMALVSSGAEHLLRRV